MKTAAGQHHHRRTDVGVVPFWRRPVPIGLACAALFAIVLFAYAGPVWPIVLHELLTDGLLSVTWIAAAFGWGTLLLLPVPLGERGSMLAVTCVALGLGAMSLLTLALGLLGWLLPIAAWAMVIIGLAGCALAYRKWLLVSLPREVAPVNWFALVAIPFLSVAVMAAMFLPGILWGDDPHGYDVVEYHLQIPREWYEAGRIVALDHNVFSFFPFNVEMHYLLAMHLRGGAWDGMYLAQLMHVWFVALTVVALWHTAGPVAAVAVASTPWLALLGGVAYNEGGLLLFGSLAIIWAMRAIDLDAGRLRAMAISGALAGFACGSKYTAAVVVAGAIVLGIALVLRRRSLVPIAVFSAATLLTFAPWLARNAAWSGGNPVFPEAMQVFGQGHFTDDQAERWKRAHSPTPAESGLLNRLARARERIVVDWRYGYLLIPAGVVALGLSPHRRRAMFLGILLAVQIVFWLGFTHLQSRFFVLTIPIVAMVVGSVEFKSFRVGFGVAAVVLAGVNVAHVNSWMTKFTTDAIAAVGLRDVRNLLPVDLSAVPESRPILLAGDAAVFWYQIPMARLRYRTVFDVSAKPGQASVDAWVEGWPADAPILVSPGELRRFAEAYWKIPAPSEDVAAQSQPFWIRRDRSAAGGESEPLPSPPAP